MCKSFQVVATLFALVLSVQGQTIGPYTPDSNTLMLFHFDEASGSVATNLGTLGANAQSVNMTAASTTPPLVTTVLGATAYPGFGRAATFESGQLIGWDANRSSAYQGDGSPDTIPLSTWNIGKGGQSPFTIEALIAPAVTNALQEIVSADSATGTRGFQFRLNSAGQLEFNAIAAPGARILASIPSAGAQAFVANTWYHAAVTYDGTTLRLYWTSLAATNSQAQLIGAQPAAIGPSQGAAMGPLALGNENRGAAGEGFQGRIDEVRLSNIARGATQFLWHPLDTDGDGLDDAWEMTCFGTLAQTATGDPDGDGYDNLAEYLAGSNPANAASTPLNLDGDGMPDAWEQAYFGSAGRDGTGDYDRDGLTDLQEYQSGTDPTNPNSVAGDVDGDGLTDAWEQATLGGLSHGAYDDPDNDGYNNLAEKVAGTNPLDPPSHPSWKSPRVAFLRDSVVATNACLMPSGATYGRAINGVSFQKQILLTFQGYQYTAWYDTVGTTQAVWLARRSVTNTSIGRWETVNTQSEFLNGDENNWDAHNVISLGVSPLDGTLHMAWDHHGNTLRYRRSVPGLCTTNTAAWGASGMMKAEQNWLAASGQTIGSVSYPMFFHSPAGDLLFEYRTGGSQSGDHWLHKYKPAAGNWSAGWKFSAKEGTYTGVGGSGSLITSTTRNPYENGFDFGPDGTLHHTWTFRESDDSSHDIHYACSPDGGVTWRNNAGTVIANTSAGQSINVNSPGIIIKVLDGRQLLINQQAQCVDNYNFVHVLMLHRRTEPDAAWQPGDLLYRAADTAYYHYFRHPATGVWSQRRLPYLACPVNSRPKIGFDGQGNLYAVYTSATAVSVPGQKPGRLVVASASKVSQYTDWEVVQVGETTFIGEPLLDQARLLADNILSVYIQEDSATTTLVGSPLHVLDFAVNVPSPSPLAVKFFGPDTVVSFAATTNSTYQLQTKTNLVSDSWGNVGTAVAGRNGLMALPHPGGAANQSRFYRVLVGP